MFDRSDDELMESGARGDERAFRELVERWERPVFVFLDRMLGSREDAQDLCQEAFLRMIRNADRYRASGQFRSWLFRIAGNLARSRLRRRKLLRWLPFEPGDRDPPAPQADVLRDLERRETEQQVRSAVSRLPDRQREALVLKMDQELGYREIAEVMGTTTNAVQMLVHRAMTALRQDLARSKDE